MPLDEIEKEHEFGPVQDVAKRDRIDGLLYDRQRIANWRCNLRERERPDEKEGLHEQ